MTMAKASAGETTRHGVYSEHVNPHGASLFRLTEMDGEHVECNKFLVRKAAPPLNAFPEGPDRFVAALDRVHTLVQSCTRFRQDALRPAARAARM